MDLDSVPNRLLFGLNGEWAAPMGVAFEGISFEKHIYPALTAEEGTSVRLNFGIGSSSSEGRSGGRTRCTRRTVRPGGY